MAKSDLILLGFIKCGQVSMQSYLKDKKMTERNRNEIAYKPDSVREFKQLYPGCIPCFIIRNVAERAWSAYLYHGKYKTMKFIDFIKEDYSEPHFGEGNPIKCGNYERYLKPFVDAGLNPLVYDLENMQTNPDFPHENITQVVKNVPKKPFPEDYRELIYKLVRLDMADQFMKPDRTLTEKAKILILPYET